MTDLFTEKETTTNESVVGKKKITLSNVEISNYRSIKYLNIPMNDFGIILKGLNGVGKTSVIEALYFLFSGKLFDGRSKLGDQNITPTDMEKGTKTSIKATFSNGFTFAITLWEEWNNDFSLIKERKSVYEVNGGVVKRVRDAYNTLHTELGLIDLMSEFEKDPKLKHIDIVRLLYDISYLKEIDYKELRALVIDIVGDIEYKDLINKNPTKYASLVAPLKDANMDLEAAKQKLRGEKFGTPQNKSGLEQSISEYEKLIEITQIEASKEIDVEAIKNAKIELKKLDDEIVKLKADKNKSDTQLTADIDLKIANVENAILKEKDNIKQEHEKQVKEIELANLELDKPLHIFQDTINKLNNQKDSLSREINDINYNLSLKYNDIKDKERELKHHQEKRQELVIEWQKTKNPQSELITAPKSKEQFYLHEALEYVAIRDKKLAEITKKGQAEKLAIDGLQEMIKTLKNDYAIQEKKVIEKQEARNELDKQIKVNQDNLEKHRQEIQYKEKPLLSYNTKSINALNDKLISLRNERESLLTFGTGEKDNLIESKIAELETQKEALREILNQEIILKDNQKRLSDYQETLKTTKRRLLEVNELLTLIKELEKDKFTQIDSKVADSFGNNIKFKLFDYNITDESINTKMCDLLVLDGNGALVNIKDLNTGHYPLLSLDLITRVKAHYNIPNSFIFIDEFGVIDSQNRTKLLEFGEQIIATEKSDDKKIKVVSIKEKE